MGFARPSSAHPLAWPEALSLDQHAIIALALIVVGAGNARSAADKLRVMAGIALGEGREDMARGNLIAAATIDLVIAQQAVEAGQVAADRKED